ncbi:MAG: FtsX-like permease family protein, partial [Acidobacteriota bacterium]
ATNAGVSLTLAPLYERLVGEARPPLAILLGTVALLLLIACANVANLMLARTTVREREMAIRAALGAGRARLVRQLLTESVTLAVAGGVLGLLVTMWGIDLLPSALEARLPRADGIRVDRAVFAFTIGATLLTGILFGLAPALQTSAGSPRSLKDGGRGVSSGSRGRRLRRGITIIETALAVIVLVGAGLLARSYLSLTARDPGFTPAHLLSFNVQFVSLPDQAARVQAAAQLIDTLVQLPGVEAAGAATGLPPGTPQRGTRFAIDGLTLTANRDNALFIATTADYFKALGTPVLQGRAVDRRDAAGGAPVVVINRTLAKQLFPDGTAVGRRLKLVNPEQSGEWRTVVGVVGDIKYQGLAQEAAPTIYSPFAQTPFMWLYVLVRTPSGTEPLLRTLRSAVPTVHPSLTAANLRTMDHILAQSVAEPRFNMILVGGFAVLALVLAAMGVYGVIAYSVAQRRHEIGVRLALGAGRRDVLRLVIGEGLGMAIIGVTLGILGAAALARVIAAMLFGVTPRDPVTFAAGAASLLAVSLIASYIPARRATRVEPVTALRAD